MSVGSMLRECGLTKADVRRIAAKHGRIIRWSIPIDDKKPSGYKVDEGRIVTDDDERSIESDIVEYHLEGFRRQ